MTDGERVGILRSWYDHSPHAPELSPLELEKYLDPDSGEAGHGLLTDYNTLDDYGDHLVDWIFKGIRDAQENREKLIGDGDIGDFASEEPQSPKSSHDWDDDDAWNRGKKNWLQGEAVDPAQDIIAAKIYYHHGELPDRMERYPDPKVPGTFAVRAYWSDGETTDQLVYMNRPDGEDVEDVEFTTWPPTSGNLKFPGLGEARNNEITVNGTNWPKSYYDRVKYWWDEILDDRDREDILAEMPARDTVGYGNYPWMFDQMGGDIRDILLGDFKKDLDLTSSRRGELVGGHPRYTSGPGGSVNDPVWNQKQIAGQDHDPSEVDPTVDPEACPGCGSVPGDGTTPGCRHPDGCGHWRDLQRRSGFDSDKKKPAQPEPEKPHDPWSDDAWDRGKKKWHKGEGVDMGDIKYVDDEEFDGDMLDYLQSAIDMTAEQWHGGATREEMEANLIDLYPDLSEAQRDRILNDEEAGEIFQMTTGEAPADYTDFDTGVRRWWDNLDPSEQEQVSHTAGGLGGVWPTDGMTWDELHPNSKDRIKKYWSKVIEPLVTGKAADDSEPWTREPEPEKPQDPWSDDAWNAGKKNWLGEAEDVTCPHCGSGNHKPFSARGSVQGPSKPEDIKGRCQDCGETFDYPDGHVKVISWTDHITPGFNKDAMYDIVISPGSDEEWAWMNNFGPDSFWRLKADLPEETWTAIITSEVSINPNKQIITFKNLPGGAAQQILAGFRFRGRDRMVDIQQTMSLESHPDIDWQSLRALG